MIDAYSVAGAILCILLVLSLLANMMLLSENNDLEEKLKFSNERRSFEEERANRYFKKLMGK